MILRSTTSIIVGILLLSLCGCNGDTTKSPNDRWVDAIQTKDRPWRTDSCSDYLITSFCRGLKEFDDPGELPSVIRVGDIITHTTKDGKQFTFTVRNISVFTFSKDLDTVYGGERYSAKKGETICTLYDERSRSKIVKTEGAWLSRIVVKNCQDAASAESTGTTTQIDLKTALRRYEGVVGVLPKEFLRFSTVEREAYVRGVLDGEYFLAEESKAPDRDVFVSCMNARFKTILAEVKSFVEREGEQRYLMPWTLSRLVGNLCPKETRMLPKNSPEYTEAATFRKLIAEDCSDDADCEKKQDAIDKAFIRGVLDGKVFMLYGHRYPKLASYLECLSKPDSLDTIFRGMRASQLLAHNIDKSQAYDVVQGEAFVCKELK